MQYAIVVVLSVLFTFLGFITEVTAGNIRHVENGREPNAGAAIFPGIPFVPLFFVGVVWMLNRIYPNLGFWAFIGFGAWFVPNWWLSLRKLRRQFNDLVANSDILATKPETHEN